MAARRITIDLDAVHSEKLAELAARAGAPEEPLAGSLLAGALDNAGPDPDHITALLDGIPGALERAREGSHQAEAGETVPLSEL